MDVITIDIGNSSVVLGLFTQDQLEVVERLGEDRLVELSSILRSFLAKCPPDADEKQTLPVIVSSVNGPWLKLVEDAVSETFDQNILLVGRDVPLFINIALPEPENIGTDRLLTASAAYDHLEHACVIADFGSATTIDCVNDQGIFIGGTIMPGLKMSANALHDHTDTLPEIDITVPDGDYGIDTKSAMQHGIYYGAIGALRAIVERYATVLGNWPQLVLTGGYANLIAQKCDFADSLVPDLCLTGLYLEYHKYLTAQDNEQAGLPESDGTEAEE